MTITSNCKTCGEEFSYERHAGMSGRLRKFCCVKCRVKGFVRKPRPSKLYRRQCVVCENAFATRLPGKKTCSTECQRIHAIRKQKVIANKVRQHAECEQCGKVFGVTFNRKRFCNRSCANRYSKVLQDASGAAERDAKAVQKKRERLEAARAGRCKCIRCGHLYVAKGKKSARLWCVACRTKSRKAGPPDPMGFIYSCETCGRMFIRKRLLATKVNCMACVRKREREGNKESRKESKKRREYLKRSNTKCRGKIFRTSDVFKRDSWTCQLCGMRVVKSKVSIPEQATIDHIIPLSRGGPHSLENCQCACRACNVAKRDSLPGVHKDLRAQH